MLLGADQVIDYTREDFTKRGDRYDLIFDIPGNHPFSECRRALTPEGRYVLIGHEKFGESGKRTIGLIPHFFKLMFLSPFVKQLPKHPVTGPHRPDLFQLTPTSVGSFLECVRGKIHETARIGRACFHVGGGSP